MAALRDSAGRLPQWETGYPANTVPPVLPKILIVDDHAGFRASIARLLAADGFDVVGEAEDGRTALAAANALAPDVILLDVQLPDTDGFELAGLLSAELNGHTPAVVLTSSRDWSDFGRSLLPAAARGFLPKAELSGAGIAAALAA